MMLDVVIVTVFVMSSMVIDHACGVMCGICHCTLCRVW